MRRWTFISLLIGLMLGLATVSAQESSWTTWLYDAENGIATWLENDGTLVESVNLLVPVDVQAPEFAPTMAVSPNGERLAYRVTGLDATGAPLTVVIVYDVPSQAIVATYEPPISPNADTFDLINTPRLLSEGGTTLVYGFATGDTEASQTWATIVLDVASQSVLSDLRSTDEAFVLQDFESSTAPYLLPLVRDYEGANVHFTLYPYLGSGFAPIQAESFRWNIITGRVTLTDRYPTLAGDVLPDTAESISPVFDERVALNDDAVPYTNSIHSYRPDVGARAPFFASTTLDILQSYFVQNGAFVLVSGESLLSLDTVWLLVDRAGTSRTVPPIRPLNNQVLGTPEGFIYATDSQPSLVLKADTRGDTVTQTAIYTAPPNTSAMPVWVSPPEARPTYKAWAQLAPPLFTAQTVLIPDDDGGVAPDAVSPSGQLTRTGSLFVDGVAIINTEDGDRLNMRDAPTLSSNIIARVDSGARVVILDGPVAADSYVFWQVRLATGQVGWVVESADNVDTLIPAG